MAVSSTGTYWIVVTQVRGTAANAVLHDQTAEPTVQDTYASTDVQGPYDGLSAALAQLQRLTINGSVTVVDSSSNVLGSVDVATGTTSTTAAAGGASQPSNPAVTSTAVATQAPGSGTGTASSSTSSSATGTLIEQPGFAPQLTALPTPIGSSNQVGNIQRGYMIWDQPMTASYGASGGPLGDGRDMINFLFNPSTVNTDYNVGNVSLQAAMMYQVPGDNGNLLSPLLQQTVSWQLYFDRTFELLYGTPTAAKNDPTVIGCQADVLQFMQFTGVLASGSAGSYATNTTVVNNLGTQTAQVNANQAGIMMMVPCWVFFGNPFNQTNTQTAFGGTPNFEAVGTQLAFYGFISEWSVEYTHWTTNMVPIRCVISVSFTMMPTSSQTPGAAAVWQDTAVLQKNYVTAPTYPTPSGKAPALTTGQILSGQGG